MTEQAKQPEPGEYWQHKTYQDDRAYFIGRTPEGVMVWQCRCDSVESGNVDWSDWRHLPDCTGWDWQPETYPQYWTTVSPLEYAYCLRVDRDVYRVIKLDGTMEKERAWNGAILGGRKQITKEHAESLVMKPKATPRLVPVRLWCRYERGNRTGHMYVFANTEPPIGAGIKYSELHSDEKGGWCIEVNQ